MEKTWVFLLKNQQGKRLSPPVCGSQEQKMVRTEMLSRDAPPSPAPGWNQSQKKLKSEVVLLMGRHGEASLGKRNFSSSERVF